MLPFLSEIPNETSDEEINKIFNALMNCGNLSKNFNHEEDETIMWYLKAFSLLPRAEPLTKLASIYRIKKQYHTAYMFIKMASLLRLPNDEDNEIYSYWRWHVFGSIVWFIGRGNPLFT